MKLGHERRDRVGERYVAVLSPRRRSSTSASEFKHSKLTIHGANRTQQFQPFDVQLRCFGSRVRLATVIGSNIRTASLTAILTKEVKP